MSSEEKDKRYIPSNPMVIEYRSGVLVVAVQDEFNDYNWGAHFGTLQSALRKRVWEHENGGKFEVLKCNLTKCTWIDPTPILSLLISIGEFFLAGGNKVELVLPSLKKLGNSKEPSVPRLTKFFFQEGFADAFLRLGKEGAKCHVFLGHVILTPVDREIIDRSSVDMAYNNSTCLPAEILSLGDTGILKLPGLKLTDTESIDQWVASRMQGLIDPLIKSNVPIWAHHSLSYRVQLFLRETLHNILEHAYSVEDGKRKKYWFAGVYVRFRQGGLRKDNEDRIRVEKYLKRESLGGPTLEPQFVLERNAFLELFVVDAGIGIHKTLSQILLGEGLFNLNHVMKAAFDGKSRKKAALRTTEFGGLKLIRDLFEHQKDHVRVRDHDTWWGATLPFNVQGQGVWTVDARSGGVDSSSNVRGLYWTARLSWLTPMDDLEDGTWAIAPEENLHPGLIELKTALPLEEKLIKLISSVVDNRFQAEMLKRDASSSRTAFGLFLPQLRLMKNDVVNAIIASGILTSFDQDGVLLIGDISPFEAPTFIAALNESKFLPEKLTDNVKRIVLVTRWFAVCMLDRSVTKAKNGTTTTYKINKKEAPSYFNEKELDRFNPSISFRHYLRLLRFWDSLRLWDQITQDPSSNMVVLHEKIVWNEDHPPLTTYMDFPQTLVDPRCRDIYELSLYRLRGFYRNKPLVFQAMDVLVDSLVTRFNAILRRQHLVTDREKEKHTIFLGVGSIRVTGLTSQHSLSGNPRQVQFHFFHHPEGGSNSFGHAFLCWLGDYGPETICESDRNLCRIGGSAVIAEDGWKAFPMPRWRMNKAGKFDSVYHRTPAESYKQWQNRFRPLLKMGHWRYGGHHDLLTLNLLVTYNPRMDQVGLPGEETLSLFLFHVFIKYFKMLKRDLTTAGKHLWERSQQSKVKKDEFSRVGKDAIMVYPSHPVTDHVVEAFLELFEPNARNTLRNRIIGLLPVKKSRTGSAMLISGLAKGRLKRHADQEKPPPVLIFDDGVISGRTYEEIRQLLQGVGLENIYSLVIVDRRRLPAARYIKEGRNICYWRFDVPQAGTDASCPICMALSKVTDFRSNLSNFNVARERLSEWLEQWRPRNPITDWADGGLSLEPLKMVQKKKFGIRKIGINTITGKGIYKQINGDEEKIRVETATALATYATEFHSMTSMDQLAKKIDDKTELSHQARIQLFASQLILFGKEFDPEIVRQYTKRLLESCESLDYIGRHTVLAVLCLINLPRELLAPALGEFLDERDKGDLDNTNLDFDLFLAYSISRGIVRPEHRSKISTARSLLGAAQTLTERYTRLHQEILTETGAFHSGPMHRLIDPNTNSKLDRISLMGARSACSVLALLGKDLELLVRQDKIDALTKFRKSAANFQKIFQQDIDHYLSRQNNSFDDRGDLEFKKIQRIGRQLLNYYKNIHQLLFSAVEMKEVRALHDGQFTNELKRLSSNIEKSTNWEIEAQKHDITNYSVNRSIQVRQARVCEISPYIKEAHVIWDRKRHTAVSDLMLNAVYAEKSIFRPGFPARSKEKAHLWIIVEYKKDAVWLHMYNYSKNSAVDASKNTKGKRPWKSLNEIGGNLEYPIGKNGIFKTLAKIPYAHSLE